MGREGRAALMGGQVSDLAARVLEVVEALGVICLGTAGAGVLLAATAAVLVNAFRLVPRLTR